MKNIHILPTDKPTIIFKSEIEPFLHLYNYDARYFLTGQNIHITSDEKIKEGDWWINLDNNTINSNALYNLANKAPSCKKIILTTDLDLIKDGVQATDDEFLEWFVKNPSCKKIELKYKDHWDKAFAYYEIILPKEEPFKHKVEVIPVEEILANRSNAYEFIDFDKQERERGITITHVDKKETKEQNPYIGSFLLRNGFKGSGGDTYYNSKCTINVLEDCYQINFNYPECGEVSTYTDSHSIPHLVGTLTWNDLIDKNYEK